MILAGSSMLEEVNRNINVITNVVPKKHNLYLIDRNTARDIIRQGAIFLTRRLYEGPGRSAAEQSKKGSGQLNCYKYVVLYLD